MSHYPPVCLYLLLTNSLITHSSLQQGQQGPYDPYPAYSAPNPYDYQPSPSPNPYEHEHQGFQPIHPDPFATSQSPPPPNLYHAPSLHATSPPPQQDYLNPSYSNFHSVPPPPPLPTVTPPPNLGPSPSPFESAHGHGYDLHDDPNDDNIDTGDIPLLRRDKSTASSTMVGMPGDYDPVTPDDRSESNIRYGRIPQRVPRLYKTIKRIE